MLNSAKAEDFYQRQLKRVRDKCAFHFDNAPATDFIERVADGQFDGDEHRTVYIEENDDPAAGYFPMAGLMIASWFLGIPELDKMSSKIEEDSRMVGNLIQALNDVADMLILEAFPDCEVQG